MEQLWDKRLPCDLTCFVHVKPSRMPSPRLAVTPAPSGHMAEEARGLAVCIHTNKLWHT